MKVLLVGEDNPYGNDPKYALYHLPVNAAGDRLRRHLGLTVGEYRAIEKVNLCSDRWRWKEARAKAAEIVGREDLDVVVMCGAKVKSAFGREFMPSFTAMSDMEGLTMISLPHPSGRCRDWNWSGADDAARKLWREYCSTEAAPDPG